MILTEDFVYIHFPKTGGTFVSKTLEKILPRLKKKVIFDNKHGLCRDIPKEYKNLPVLTCVRSPFDIKVSEFKYGWWKKLASQEMVNSIKTNYPQYPDLTFEEFVYSLDKHSRLVAKNRKINPYMKTKVNQCQTYL